MIVPGPAFHRNLVPTASGPSSEADLTAGFQLGQASIAEITCQTAPGPAFMSIWSEAIPLYEQTLAARERLLGPDHPDTLTSRNNLANARRARSEPD